MRKKPSEEIREIYDKRREQKGTAGDIDEYDMLFGKASTLELSIIEYLDRQNRFGAIRRLLVRLGVLSECCGSTGRYNSGWGRFYCKKCDKRIW